MRQRGLRRLAPGLGAALLALAGAATAAPAPPLQHVTLIGDSVASSLTEDPRALAILSQGIDFDNETAPCRRIEGESCPQTNGVRPPSAVQLVQSMGSKIGPTVIVAAGYNDYADTFPQTISDALAAFKAAGVQHVLWLTLRAAQHPYVGMNDEVLAAAAQHPELVVVDWNLYSRSHPEWFQADGLHLVAAGSEAMATLVHQNLVALGIAATPTVQKRQHKTAALRVATARLPAATRGRRYSAKLTAVGGRAPYFWSFPAKPPLGLHLRPTGWIFGTPRGRPRTIVLAVHVADARGGRATQRLVLRVR